MKKIYKKSIMESLKTLDDYQVTIVQAPIGFGKTTTLKQCYYKGRGSYSWFDLDHMELKECNSMCIQNKYKRIFLDHVKRRHFYEGIIDTLISNDIQDFHIIIICSDSMPSFFMDSLDGFTYQKIDVMKFHFNLKDIRHLTDINNISISEDNLCKIYEYSGGWVKGIIILLEAYEIFNTVKVTEHYKQMIDQDMFMYLEENIRITLCYLYDLKEIPLDILLYFENGDEILFLLKNISSIGWLASYNEKKNVYSLTEPFKAFLSEKAIKYKLDLKSLYLQFAQLYERKLNYLEAIRFYEKIGDFDRIIFLLESYPKANFTDYDAELMKKVYDGIPYNLRIKHPYVYLHMIHDHLSTFHDHIYGFELLRNFTDLVEQGFYKKRTKKLKGELCMIKGIISFNDLKQMFYYFNEAHSYLVPEISGIVNNKMIVTFGCPHILFLYHHESGNMAELSTVLYENLRNYYEITEFSSVGIAQEAETEYHLEQGRYQEAEALALEAYYKANDFSQNCIAAAALLTLGRASLLTYRKDMYQYAIDSLKKYKEKAVAGLLRSEIDCALGYLYALNGDLHNIEEWLVNGQRQYLLDEANSYVYVIYGLILLKQKQFFRLKVIADILSKIHVHCNHIFGDIYALLYKTIADYNLQDIEAAKISFQELIEIAEADRIVMPLVELSDYIEPFLQFDARSSYMKLLNEKIREKHFTWRTSVFSEREQEIIRYIIVGYTRKRTAEILNLKESTIATYMKRIYKKAGVNDKEGLKNYCKRL
ncbi:MAG: response regulator transcription factor [[Clostridium] innocuum]|nr:response regulator transcription factor [[Clostridium] innocuum]